MINEIANAIYAARQIAELGILVIASLIAVASIPFLMWILYQGIKTFKSLNLSLESNRVAQEATTATLTSIAETVEASCRTLTAHDRTAEAISEKSGRIAQAAESTFSHVQAIDGVVNRILDIVVGIDKNNSTDDDLDKIHSRLTEIQSSMVTRSESKDLVECVGRMKNAIQELATVQHGLLGDGGKRGKLEMPGGL